MNSNSKPTSAAKRRVLIVEDNIDGARMLAALLRSMGHEVDYAMNGRAALSVADAFNPDIVIVDLSLPDITGWEVATALRQKAGSEQMRIYATTGHYGEEARQRSLACGCDDHFVKPLDPAVIIKLLEM